MAISLFLDWEDFLVVSESYHQILIKSFKESLNFCEILTNLNRGRIIDPHTDYFIKTEELKIAVFHHSALPSKASRTCTSIFQLIQQSTNRQMGLTENRNMISPEGRTSGDQSSHNNTQPEHTDSEFANSSVALQQPGDHQSSQPGDRNVSVSHPRKILNS